ncbi:MAG: hypothetical protein PHY15_02800 [Eubacteriales bacterium]|nr:hypothetical protein [Eubacteriales bacterium]MDD4475705.1 hypothetical protein [Eubacteriales bacterium]
MKLEKSNIVFHGQREIKILSPCFLNPDTTLATNGLGYYYIISNGTGYSVLAELFSLGISLSKDEIIYLPFEFKHTNYYKCDFDEQQYKGLILANYCTSQFKAKEIVAAVEQKPYKRESIELSPELPQEDVDFWKVRHRTTVAKHGRHIIISTNGDGFASFAMSCINLSEYGDDVKYNDFPPHMHHDWYQSTSKSLGITLYYWQSPVLNF